MVKIALFYLDITTDGWQYFCEGNLDFARVKYIFQGRKIEFDFSKNSLILRLILKCFFISPQNS